MLSCKAAIKKHLLSHRPETDWPYECPFCFKRFQAKGDLPKHFFTSQHKEDPRIPPPGSLEWHQLLNQCCVIPDWVLPSRRKIRSKNPHSHLNPQADEGIIQLLSFRNYWISGVKPEFR